MNSAFVRVVDFNEVPPALPEELALKTPYLPDRWQRFAVEAIEKGENILATCPTGSGKTYVGEYQIAKSLQRGGRVFYTTPIKSLSNQKFHDLTKLFPEASVGIMTGDIKYRPDAQIIIMTTEILRNLLFKRGTATEHVGTTALLSLDGLDAVVFDEVHYINDPDRGHVWEETLMLLPPEVKLILLSATLSNPYKFAEWLGEQKKVKIWLISTQWRAVPLEHCVLDDEGKLIVIHDAKEVFHIEAYRSWFVARRDGLLAADRFKEKVKDARRSGFEGPVSGKTRPKSFEHQLNACLDDLHGKGQLPAIVFQFSRAGCERLAKGTTGTFLDSSDAALVNTLWHFHLSRYKASLETSPQYHSLLALAQRGIAFHHSGLLPFLKEILEVLFSRGLIKVLFATETFAVGINMPTKTVIFTALEKWTDGSIRLLRSAEYIQMAGRAGRRGKDDKGVVIYLPQRDPVEVEEMRHILTGKAMSFCSRINFHYDFVLKMILSGRPVGELIEKSYWWVLEQEEQAGLVRELEGLKQRWEAIPLTEEQQKVCASRESIDERIATSQNAKKKAAQRDLEAWKAEHKESQWTPVLARYASKKGLEVKIQELESYVAGGLARGDDVPVIPARLAVLEECGYVGPDHSLTEKGRLATEVNEGHPFLMTEFFLNLVDMYQRGVKPPVEDILSVLALFLGEQPDGESNKAITDLDIHFGVKEMLREIQESAVEFQKAEKKVGLYKVIADDANFWRLSTEWIEPVQTWVTNPEATLATIASEFDLFEGNVQRALMKLSGLVDEMKALASLTGSIEILKVLEGCHETVLRGLVLAESLYLRL